MKNLGLTSVTIQSHHLIEYAKAFVLKVRLTSGKINDEMLCRGTRNGKAKLDDASGGLLAALGHKGIFTLIVEHHDFCPQVPIQPNFARSK